MTDVTALALGAAAAIAVAFARRGSRQDGSKEATLTGLRANLRPGELEAWVQRQLGSAQEAAEQLRDWPLDWTEQYLEEEYQIDVREDGLIGFWELRPEVRRVIGDHEVALYHHTASGALPAIRRQGLRAGVPKADPMRRSEHVFLTTEVSGPAVRGYLTRARQLHGGRPVTLTVRVGLDEIQPDPDDAHLRSGRYQWVTGYVHPSAIVEWE